MRIFSVIILSALLLAGFVNFAKADNGAGAAGDGICSGALPCLWQGIERCLGEQKEEACGICELIQLLINAFYILLALVGGVALIMFIWGGTQWLTSAGSDEKVTKGRGTIVGAVIGLVIVFGAWTLVNLVIFSLAGPSKGELKVGGLFGQPWYYVQLCPVAEVE